MKTLKKLFSVSAIVALLGTLAPMYAFGATYTAELEEAYNYAHKNGITTMSSIDNANMFGTLTRIAMAKMIANYATTVLGLEADTSAKCTFTDVTAALDAQYDNGVTNACQLGLMGQNITAFRPNDPVTRGEFGTTLSRALNRAAGTTIEEGTPYYENHLKYLKDNKIMNDISNPNMNEVRGYVMLMMMRADDSYEPATEGCTAEELLACVTADDYDACIAACSGEEEEEEEDLPGYASISTKAASTQTVALNAVEKKIGTVTLKAGENDTTITSIEITKAGLGDDANVGTIQLMKDGQYVTNAAQLNVSKRTMTMRFSPKLTIKANKSETFDVVVSLKGTGSANGQYDFSVTAVTVVNGKFGGTPAKLGSLVTTNYLVEDVEVDLTNANGGLQAGDEKADLLTIELTPGAEAEISSVTLTSTDKDELDKVLSNVKAYVNDEVVGTVTVNDETITIEGLKETVKKGKKLEIALKGDVTYVGEALSFHLTVEDNHVYAVETNTNERMASALKITAVPANLKVSGVDLTLKNTIKTSKKVAPGEDDVVLAEFELTAGSDLEVTSYYVDLSASTTPVNFNHFEDKKLTLYVDGVNYDITGTTLEITKKADSFVVSAGDKVTIQVVGDTEDTVLGDTINNIEFGIKEVKNTETNKTVKPTGTATELVKAKGHKTTFTAGDVMIKDTLKTDNNLIEEGETSDVLGFSVKANNEKITLKSLEFTVAGYKAKNSAGDDVEIVNKVELFKKGATTPIKSVEYDKIAEKAGVVTMDSLSQTIDADATAEYVLKVTLNNGAVTVLGNPVTFTLNKSTFRPASATTDTTDNTTITKAYSVSSVKPAFTITKNGNKITVDLFNDSEYDLKLDGFALQVIGNVNDNGNNPFATALAPSPAVWTLQDTNGNVLGNTAVKYDGTTFATIAFGNEEIKAGETGTYVVVMPQKAAIQSSYYEAEERLVNFIYVDDPDQSKPISADYNGGAAGATFPTVTVTASVVLAAETATLNYPTVPTTVNPADLQEDIVVANGKITGTLKATPAAGHNIWNVFSSTTYAGYHFIALKIMPDSSLTCDQVQVGITSPVYLDSDCNIIVAVNGTTSPVQVIYGSTTDEYDLSELGLE